MKTGTETYQKLWGMAKAVHRGKFMVINAHLKKNKSRMISNLLLYLKELEK